MGPLGAGTGIGTRFITVLSAVAENARAAELVDKLSTNALPAIAHPWSAAAESLAQAPGLIVVLTGGAAEPLTELTNATQAIADRLLVFVDQTTDAAEVPLLAFQTTLRAMIVKQRVLQTDEMLMAVQKVLDTGAGAGGLGLERYLAPGGILDGGPRRLTLVQSTDRGRMLNELQGFLGGLGDARRVAQVLTVADELITNAFYHAPVDGIGGHPYSHVSRMDRVVCKPGREIEVAFARDEHRVAVSVRDCYGSLKQPQLRAHLAKAATVPTANFKVSGGPGGAKLGLVTALRAASQLIFNVVPGELTEGIGVIATAGSYRQFIEAGRSLHLFSLPSAAGQS